MLLRFLASLRICNARVLCVLKLFPDRPDKPPAELLTALNDATADSVGVCTTMTGRPRNRATPSASRTCAIIANAALLQGRR
jgi:hypothetical protein